MSGNTIGIPYGVFCKQEYHFSATEPYVMFDIGFNIGTTSLYWARDQHINQIYGFEPFRPTWEIGKENLERNPSVSNKIELFNFGLGDSDKELEFHYNPKMPGCMSTVNDRYKNKPGFNIEKIQIKKASDVLKPLFLKHTEKKFLKIDCEGSEFEILPDLDNAGLLKEVSAIIMEWHDKDPEPLVNILTKNGFMVHCSNDISFANIGMIIAFKN